MKFHSLLLPERFESEYLQTFKTPVPPFRSFTKLNDEESFSRSPLLEVVILKDFSYE